MSFAPAQQPPAHQPPALILGIESSCDETAAAIVDASGRVLSDVVASQVSEHAPFGGIVPELAARSHLKAMVPTVAQAFRDADVEVSQLSAVAVTQGPGLMGALLVGLQFAKSVALVHGLPLLAVNHLEAHLLAVFLQRRAAASTTATAEIPSSPPAASPARVPTFPFIGLLVSGGHTSLYEVRASQEFELLSTTRDDAAGEAFDKAGKLLGLPYPGGPVIDRLAAQGNPHAVPFPVPMKGRPGLDFSFSGLKTAVAHYVRRSGVPEGDAGAGRLADVCASFQRCVVEALLTRAFRACEVRDIPRLVLAGGVAANRGLRDAAEAEGLRKGVAVFCPDRQSCTDNAAMIAYHGAQRFAAGERDDLSLAAFSRAAGFRKGKLTSS